MSDKDTLQTRYRPNTWQNIIGQEHITDVLKGIIKNKTYNYTRSYIWAGNPGSGKTSTARLFARAINCDHQDKSVKPCNECHSCKQFLNNQYQDYIEVDAGQYNKVEDVKRLLDIAKIYPVHSHKHRIVLIDEAHRLSNAAWDSMLKLLEDGKTKTIFMFATTEGDKIRKAIHSRSISFQVKPLSVKEIQQELIRICTIEKIPYDIPSIDSIAYAFRGRMRDAIKTLDMYYRSQQSITNITLSTPEEKFCNILRLTAMQKHQEAIDELDRMVTDQSNLYQSLCTAITAIYSFPIIHTSSVPESLLQQTKTLIGHEIKRIIDSYMEYKPQTYEQIKLFILVLCDIASQAQKSNQQTQVRQLFKSRKQEQIQQDEDDF